MKFDITRNFNNIFTAVSNKGVKRTAFAKAMGYSSTSQLAATLEGEALISTKAIIELIKNFNVSPNFLFTGQGEIFLTDESEMEGLQKKCSDWERKYFTLQDELFKCKAELERAIYRYNKLIDITSIALEKSQKPDEKEEKEVKTKKNK